MLKSIRKWDSRFFADKKQQTPLKCSSRLVTAAASSFPWHWHPRSNPLSSRLYQVHKRSWKRSRPMELEREGTPACLPKVCCWGAPGWPWPRSRRRRRRWAPRPGRRPARSSAPAARAPRSPPGPSRSSGEGWFSSGQLGVLPALCL